MSNEGYKGADSGIETGEDSRRPTAEIVDALDRCDMADFEKYRLKDGEVVKHLGLQNQVVPLRDAEKVLRYSSPIALIACLCRNWGQGKG